MHGKEEETPPSSVNGDEVSSMEDDIFLEEVEEIELNDDEIEEMEDDDNDDDFENFDDRLIPEEDHAAVTFAKHIGPIFSCDIHPDGKLAATGGGDDKGYVWSLETGDVLVECGGHTDSVVFTDFSFDGYYLATVDMKGRIKIWKVNTGSTAWPVVYEYEIGVDKSWAQWHYGAHVLLCGLHTGDIYIIKIPSGELKIMQGHNLRVECFKVFPDGVRLVAGYSDGAVKVWDMKNCTMLHQIPANILNMRVAAVDAHPDNNLFVAINEDGEVILATSSNGKIVWRHNTGGDLETCNFSQDPAGYLALGYLVGPVGIWDIRRQMLRHYCQQVEDDEHGVCKMRWFKHILMAGNLDGSIRVYDTRTGARIAMFTGHRATILDFAYNAKEKVILAASEDNTSRVFKFDIGPYIDNN